MIILMLCVGYVKVNVDVISIFNMMKEVGNGENSGLISYKLIRSWYMEVIVFVKVKVCMSFKIKVEGEELFVK